MPRPISADFIIIGSGIAGLRAAVALAAHGRVLVLTKAGAEAGSTGYAQGGIAAAVGPDDSPELHLADTLAAGDGLCDVEAVRVLVTEGRAYVQELMAWGADFDRDAAGAPALAIEGAHSRRRVLHARDATGREISRVLGERLRAQANVDVHDHATVVQLVADDGRIGGVRFLDAAGTLIDARAKATLVATGGAGQVFRETTNPSVATGDGVALAYLAGARVTDLEFVQFHPTALAVPGVPRYLLSEALRGEGARLVNAAGEAFTTRYDPAGDLAPRDRVSRAIVQEQRRTGAPVYLSLAHLPAADVRARFPHVTELVAKAGLDLATDRVPVSPAAHYLMGGVATDLDARTSLPGLFAAGEAACTGVHGANRLASNSLLEGLVFGARAGAAMAAWDGHSWPTAGAPLDLKTHAHGRALDLPIAEAAVRDVMWQHAGIFRDAAGLADAHRALDPTWRAIQAGIARGDAIDVDRWRLVSLVTTARLITAAAEWRHESRGAHWRADFPGRDDLHWMRHWSDVFSQR